MDDIDRRYEQMLFERDYPTPPPEPVKESNEAMAMSTFEAPASAAAPAHPAATPGDLGMVVMDTLVGLFKGAIAQTAGMFGDAESIIRIFTEHNQKLLTTDEFKRLLPSLKEGVQIDPRRRQAAASAEEAGTFLPVAPIGVVKGVAKTIRKGVTR